jgi:hypothetical protein
MQAMAGGATPKSDEQERYYSDAENGIPFVRVQNLSVSGELVLNDVKYINNDTHEGMLKRSQVFENDLLVKITGVGRMAVASVAPRGFKGNINQHIVKIETQDRNTSEVLAAYLNTDIAEALATRRSTGGTRPALDYPSLRSIPIIYNETILTEYRNVFANYKAAHIKAKESLASIDNYLLLELGITLPHVPKNTLESRIFRAQRCELAGWRFDPEALHPERESCIAELQRHPTVKLSKAARFCRDLRNEVPEGSIYIGLENVESNTGRYVPSSDKESVSSAFHFRKGQILFPKLRPYLNKVFHAQFDGLCSTEFHVLEGIGYLNEFLAVFLRSQIVVKQTKHLMSGNTLPRLQTDDIENLLVPIVDQQLQERIVLESRKRGNDAEALFKQAEAELDQSKRQIEAMLLGVKCEY